MIYPGSRKQKWKDGRFEAGCSEGMIAVRSHSGMVLRISVLVLCILTAAAACISMRTPVFADEFTEGAGQPVSAEIAWNPEITAAAGLTLEEAQSRFAEDPNFYAAYKAFVYADDVRVIFDWSDSGNQSSPTDTPLYIWCRTGSLITGMTEPLSASRLCEKLNESIPDDPDKVIWETDDQTGANNAANIRSGRLFADYYPANGQYLISVEMTPDEMTDPEGISVISKWEVQNAAEGSTGPDWKEMYRKLLNGELEDGAYAQDVWNCALFDIDENGVPELLLMGQSNMYGDHLFAVSADGLQHEYASGGDGILYLYAGQNKAVTLGGSQGYNVRMDWTVQDGRLVQSEMNMFSDWGDPIANVEEGSTGKYSYYENMVSRAGILQIIENSGTVFVSGEVIPAQDNLVQETSVQDNPAQETGAALMIPGETAVSHLKAVVNQIYARNYWRSDNEFDLTIPLVSVRIKSSELQPEERAGFLYWYVSSHFANEDPRVQVNDAEVPAEYAVLKDSAAGMLKGLTGIAGEEDIQAFYDRYCSRTDETAGYIWGQTGGQYSGCHFSEGAEITEEDGRIRISGEITNDNSSSVGQYAIYCVPEETGLFDGYAFDELVVDAG